MGNNWHDTLNLALMAGSTKERDLVALWPLGSNIQYGEYVYHIVEQGKALIHISVYRSNTGRYETAISYRTN